MAAEVRASERSFGASAGEAAGSVGDVAAGLEPAGASFGLVAAGAFVPAVVAEGAVGTLAIVGDFIAESAVFAIDGLVGVSGDCLDIGPKYMYAPMPTAAAPTRAAPSPSADPPADAMGGVTR